MLELFHAVNRCLLKLQLPVLFTRLRFMLTILLILNIRSFPLVWHARIFRHFIGWFLRRLTVTDIPRFLEETSPVGENPFDRVISHLYWAGPDDCDFLGHLSNSAYAKNLDIIRAKACVTFVRPFMLAGGFMPLAGAEYSFITPIPLFSRYEVRARVAGWDEKWLYLYSEFVTYPRRKEGSKTGLRHGLTLGPTACISHGKIRSTRPDGTMLHCIAISRYCCKFGQITVPPRIALAVCGFGKDRTNWERTSSMRQDGCLQKFLEGGWKKEDGWKMPEFEDLRMAGIARCRQLTHDMNMHERLSITSIC